MTEGEKLFYARIEEMYIPKGAKPDFPMSPKDRKRFDQEIDNSMIKLEISFIRGKEGEGDVNIFFSPLINRAEGTWYQPLRMVKTLV